MGLAKVVLNSGDSSSVVSSPTYAGLAEKARLFDQIVYVDTPIANTVSQVRPFYEDGVFQSDDTPVFLRRRLSLSLQTILARRASLRPARMMTSRELRKLPVRDGGIVFYPFNSQSNMNAVADRSLHHVLILHGESNKAASYRPAARLYDYITVAGPLARQRYLRHAIFSQSEMDGGRVIMMGDTFVQTLNWVRPAPFNHASTPAILYCPTWEGYGGEENNYSSISGGYGFEAVIEATQELGLRSVIVKPHPYLGTLKPRMLAELLRGLKRLRAEGLKVRVALAGANFAVRTAVNLGFGRRYALDHDRYQDIGLALVDISGMEAVFLKQNIPHVVLAKVAPISASLQEIYKRKSLAFGTSGTALFRPYLGDQAEIDNAHRNLIFGWHTPELAAMPNAERIEWLSGYVKANRYWNESSGSI